MLRCALYSKTRNLSQKIQGIAVDGSLWQNLFLLLAYIQTKTALILVGKPSSSKTLAMNIIRNRVSNANRHELKAFKPIEVVPFQCSRWEFDNDSNAAFIGLSNWALVAAKMNRIVCHLCAVHNIDDSKKLDKWWPKTRSQINGN